MIDKALIREQMKSERLSLDETQRRIASERVVTHFSRVLKGVRWLLYAPVQNEISPKPLFDRLRARGEKVFFPRVNGDDLEFFQVNEWTELVKGPYSLEPSPQAPNWEDDPGPTLVIVPGLAFTRTGERLGFGKGYYDRFLNEYPRFPRIAIAYDFQISLAPWATEPHDERMDYIFTPAGIWASPRVL